ncbi:MAG: phosphoribosylglycinamide formyltransferase-1 [Parasphingorhabdus sp.]
MAKPLIAAVLISGSGSNLQAIIDAIRERSIPCQIEVVISNVAEAFGLQRAKQAGIKTHIIEHKNFVDRHSFDEQIIKHIDQYNIDLLILAGFMRILTDEFVEHYRGRMINIHPSLLPDLKGLNTHQRALDSGAKMHGATVHYVTPELDSGPIAVEGQLNVLSEQTAQELQQRVHHIEHRIYPLVIEWLANRRLEHKPSGLFLDGTLLNTRGMELYFEDL